jgi:hypothetical protein
MHINHNITLLLSSLTFVQLLLAEFCKFGEVVSAADKENPNSLQGFTFPLKFSSFEILMFAPREVAAEILSCSFCSFWIAKLDSPTSFFNVPI